jgi:hypothetical protein
MEGDSATYVCETCGRTHSGLPTDRAFKLPDEVWAIPEGERQERAKWTSDLCQLDDNYFLRCFLPLPFKSRKGHFGWGVWVKVSRPVFERYLQIYEQDATNEPKAQGELANHPSAYELPSSVPVTIRFGTPSERPVVEFPSEAVHELAQELAFGISDARYHEILVSVGVLAP